MGEIRRRNTDIDSGEKATGSQRILENCTGSEPAMQLLTASIVTLGKDRCSGMCLYFFKPNIIILAG